MDVLYFDEDADLHYKAVVKSPVRHLAEEAAAIPGSLVVTGNEMGGGAISNVLVQRANEHEVVMSVSSAATIHHDFEKVRASGIKVVEDDETEELINNPKYSALTLGDLQTERLKKIVEGFGVSFSFDLVGVCAQDHGVSAPGMSHLDFRHNIFKQALDESPFPHALIYRGDSVPSTMNRLRSIAESAATLPTNEVYVMDSGMAAILGASMDAEARAKEKVLILDVATSHTLGAALIGEEIAGFFEYHTKDITLERLEQLLPDLADGNLSHKQILAEGGHGAYIRKAVGFNASENIIAVGPKRKLVEVSQLPIMFGAPFGDNMMTGTVGILEAIRRHKGLPTINYL
jgi:uncharacterized protein (DUF1786 family)